MQIGFRLLRRHSTLHPSDEPETPPGTLVQTVKTLNLFLVHHGHPESRGKKQLSAPEVRRGNAENREGMLVQLHRTPYDRRIAEEMIAPIGIAEYDVRAAVGAVLIGAVKEAAKIRLDAQRIEVISAGFIEPDLGRVTARVQPCRSEVKREDAIEATVAVAQILVIGIRVQRLAPLFDRVEAL